MRKWFSMIVIMTVLFGLVPMEGHARTDEKPERFIVFLNGKESLEKIELLGGKIVYDFKNIEAATIEMNTAGLNQLLQLNLISSFSKEKKVEIEGQTVTWGHKSINLSAKQPTTLSGAGVKVAIIDTGVDTGHQDLKVSGGTCVLDLVKDPNACDKGYMDEEGHGTHVAGIIASQDNEVGTVGVAPNAEIYAVKALGADGNGTSTTIMAGIDWAIQNKVDIINLSLTTPTEDLGIKQMVDRAYQNGIIVIAAAGNTGTTSGVENTVLYPAKFESVIAVGAVNQLNYRFSSSSTGAEVELAAPGEMIYSTFPGGYAMMSGTSMAAPFVVGLAALYKEKYPTLSNVEIRKLLQTNARDLGLRGKDSFYGYGLAQVDTAVVVPPLEVPYEVAGNGVVTLSMTSILEKFESYNLYRFDQLLVSDSNEATVTDYGSAGAINYTIYPIEAGVENREKAIFVEVPITSPSFVDLGNEIWYNRYLTYLHSENIIYGYGKNMIKPSKLVTRAEAVTMLGRALNWSGVSRPTRFKDVAADSFASGYIEVAAEKGIVLGRLDKTFRPDQPVTRAEMAILLSKAYELPVVSNISFSDVNSNVAGYQEISNLAGAKITEGYPDGTFKPGQYMTRATYSVFLAKVRGFK